MTNKGETTVSSLIIPNAQMADSGVYSCQNGHGIDPVDVHVVVSPYGESGYLTGFNQFRNEPTIFCVQADQYFHIWFGHYYAALFIFC